MVSAQYVYSMHRLGKTYPGGKEVLKDISLSFLPGAKIGVLGLNGAGKSTTIKHIIGLMEPKKGTVTINGKTIRDDMTAYRSSFSFIPETTNYS